MQRASEHVRISAKGRRILKNKKLVSKIVKAIVEKRSSLGQGENILVDGVKIQLTTTMTNLLIIN